MCDAVKKVKYFNATTGVNVLKTQPGEKASEAEKR